MSITISAIDFYLPKEKLDNNFLESSFGFEKTFLTEKLGIQERARANFDESCHSLAHQAAVQLIKKHGIDISSIELLLVVTQTPDYPLPNVASMLQCSLNVPKTTAALDINLGCSGFVYALAVAKSMMLSLGYKRTLIVTAEVYSKIILKSDRSTMPLFGDAAAATLLDISSTGGLQRFDLGTDGSGAESLILRTGGSKNPQSSSNPVDNHIYMHGRSIYNFMMKTVPVSVERCLSANQLTLNDIDFFVFHQASYYMLMSLMKRLHIDENKMVFALDFCGNTVSSSIPIALNQLINSVEIEGKTVLLCGFGVGLSWGSVVVNF